MPDNHTGTVSAPAGILIRFSLLAKPKDEQTMLLEQMNWMQVEEYLKREDRLVLVLGSTEDHGYYSLATDTQIPWEIAKIACEQEGVILAPALPYGPSPNLMAYPGTVSVDSRTYLDLVEQILRSFIRHGFRRILILSGHGGNVIVERLMGTLREQHSGVMIKFRSSYVLPSALDFQVKRNASPSYHGSWIEGFPWINQVGPIPDVRKPDVDWTDYKSLTPEEVRDRLVDGTGGGIYALDEQTMREYFQLHVDDVLAVLRGEWKA
jgi:creatinine amidohydrolase